MIQENTVSYIKNVFENMPTDWLKLTTHRLDIYNEELAKSEFLEQFEQLSHLNLTDPETLKIKLSGLPTAYDYIRLGHPLSCILEWAVGKSNDVAVENVISFSSQIMPILAILRKNLLDNTKTQIIYKDELPKCFDADLLRNTYGYKFDLIKYKSSDDFSVFDGVSIYLTSLDVAGRAKSDLKADFVVGMYSDLGSITLVNESHSNYISEILHVRRRESIAMSPNDSLTVLKNIITSSPLKRIPVSSSRRDLATKAIRKISNTAPDASVALGSSGLSVQYAIMMGLINHAQDNHKGKDIKFIVPPNCYGGTNDQARRVATCIDNVEILDLAVDDGQDMVQSIERILDQVANEDSVPFIIAEIPTNPRVEIPDLAKLRDTLSKNRKTKDGQNSVAPVFVLDQTFCPNVKFLGEGDFLSTVKTISYVSGSKFPSGGLCTAGYCVANTIGDDLIAYVNKHLRLCDNEATDLQIEILSKQMPSMLKRIDDAYKNTRGFVNFIQETLPQAKMNFVSEELAALGFTPSVFSLDLPTRGDTHEERESFKRELNLKLINLMIQNIPEQSKHCVSYGQLQGCYWTIPATSTQGTTKEGDKDYIVRVAISPDFDLKLHNKIFAQFCNDHIKY